MGVVVALDSEPMIQDSWRRLSSKCRADWHQRFVIRGKGELWQSMQVDMILGDSIFDGRTFYFSLGVSLLLGSCSSAVITHNLMLLRVWVQLCDTGDTGEIEVCHNRGIA